MDDTRLSVLDHLEEMRTRMLRCIICIAILFPICYIFCGDIIEWFLATFCPGLQEVQTLQVMELFFTQMKVSAIMAVVAAYPFIAWQVWRFVSPGLYAHERYYASRFVFVSTLLFALGAAIALFIVFPAVLRFALSLQSESVRMRPQLRSVINMAAVLMLGFGAVFQLPIVVYLLAITGLVSVETMRKARPVAVVIIFIIAAMVTPGPDIISQCALAVPSLLLFEMSLIVAGRAVKRKLRRREQEREPEPHGPPGVDGEGGPGPDDTLGSPSAVPPADSPAAATVPIADGQMPLPSEHRGDVPADSESPPETAEQNGSERWYENVQEEDQAQAPAAQPAGANTTSAPPDQARDLYSDGPAGSGLV